MSKGPENHQARFDTRLTKSQKALFERAASLGGFKTLSAFVIQSAQEKASIIIEKHEQILASEKDKEVFFNALLNSNKPNEALKNAVKSYEDKLEKS